MMLDDCKKGAKFDSITTLVKAAGEAPHRMDYLDNGQSWHSQYLIGGSVVPLTHDDLCVKTRFRCDLRKSSAIRIVAKKVVYEKRVDKKRIVEVPSEFATFTDDQRSFAVYGEWLPRYVKKYECLPQMGNYLFTSKTVERMQVKERKAENAAI